MAHRVRKSACARACVHNIWYGDQFVCSLSHDDVARSSRRMHEVGPYRSNPRSFRYFAWRVHRVESLTFRYFIRSVLCSGFIIRSNFCMLFDFALPVFGVVCGSMSQSQFLKHLNRMILFLVCVVCLDLKRSNPIMR